MENASYLAQRHRDQDRKAEDWNFLTGLLVAGLSARGLPADGRPALPLTILSGFLGAGKTSLVNHVLAHPSGRRVLVLVNDFGAINVDEKLIAGRSAGTLALSNGCVCCSLAGDLSRKLAEIVSAADRPDAIILEASGISDPHSLAIVVDTNPGIQLDGIITVIDAETIQAQYESLLTAGLVGQQVSGADLLILNKLDLLAEGERDAVRAWLDARAAGRPIVPAVHARVPIEVIFSVDRLEHEDSRAAGEAHAAPRFEALNLSTDAALDRDRVTRMLRALPGEVLRGKGVLRLADDPGRGAVYQRVGGRWSLTPGPRPDADVSSLVLIFPSDAAHVDKAALAEQFDRCRQR